MIDIKLINSGDELDNFPVTQSIYLELSETTTVDALKQYVSLYRTVEDDKPINLSPPYAYNLGYIKENYGEEDVIFKIDDKKVTIDPVKPLKVSSKYILYIGDELYSSNTKVTKIVSKSSKATLVVEATRPMDLKDSMSVKVLTTSNISTKINEVVFEINTKIVTLDLKKSLTYEDSGYIYKFQDTLYLKDEEFKIELDYSSTTNKEIIYLIKTVPFSTIEPIESLKPSVSIDTEAIIAFYKKADVINTTTNSPVPQYVHINAFTIPKPEGFTLDLDTNIFFSIKEAFRDYTLSNMEMYDKDKKYVIYIIEEEDFFLIEVLENTETSGENAIHNINDELLLSTEKKIL